VEHVLPVGIEHLYGWLLGLPWVVERPGRPEAPRLRWFAVDCEPLGRRRLWLLTGALDDIATDEFGVHVVFPTPAARRIVDAGEGSVVAPIGDHHNLVPFASTPPKGPTAHFSSGCCSSDTKRPSPDAPGL
jgi:hypothetical protein